MILSENSDSEEVQKVAVVSLISTTVEAMRADEVFEILIAAWQTQRVNQGIQTVHGHVHYTLPITLKGISQSVDQDCRTAKPDLFTWPFFG